MFDIRLRQGEKNVIISRFLFSKIDFHISFFDNNPGNVDITNSIAGKRMRAHTNGHASK